MSSQSGWVDVNGEQVNQIASPASGKPVKPTIKHAKMYGFIPRVSSIIDQMDKPELMDYHALQYAQAGIDSYGAWINECKDGDDYDKRFKQFMREVVKPKADEHRNNSADKGSAIHAEIERWLEVFTGDLSSFESFSPYEVTGRELRVAQTLYGFFKENRCTGIDTESRFCTTGYSGCVDIIAYSAEATYVIDIKTTNTKTFTAPYEKWMFQLGAYCNHPALTDNVVMLQAVFDADTGDAWSVKKSSKFGEMMDGLFKYHATVIQRNQFAFDHLYELWCYRKDYNPKKFWMNKEMPDSIFDNHPELRV